MIPWNDGGLKAPGFQPVCVHELTELTTRRRPRLPAIHAWDGRMDYELLNTASSALAHLIVQQGFGTWKYIPLCFEKSEWYMSFSRYVCLPKSLPAWKSLQPDSIHLVG